MTVTNNYDTITYIANGVTTNFPWTYDYDATYGALVVKNETDDITYVEGEDYTITNRTVIFNTAPANGKTIVLSRFTYRGQEVTFIEGEDFPAKDYETSLDRLFMIEQEQDKGLADETAARIAADEVLQANIDAEEAARIAADDVLQGNIDSEATARANADNALNTAITNEVSRAKSVEGSLSNLTTTAKSNLVAAINEVDAHADSISSTISGYGNIVTHNVSEFATAAQGAKADTAVQPADVGNGTITLTQGGVSKGTFTTNQKTNTTIDLDAGGAGGGNCIYLRDMQAVHQAGSDNDSYGRIDVSSYIEAGKQYSPIVLITPDYISGTYPKTRLQLLQYLKSSCWFYNNYVEVRYYTSDVPSNTTRYDVFLIETDDETSYAVSGITNGLDGINIDPQTKTNLVTAISSSSTDAQYPSAKCVYDTLQDTGGKIVPIRLSLNIPVQSSTRSVQVDLTTDYNVPYQEGVSYIPICTTLNSAAGYFITIRLLKDTVNSKIKLELGGSWQTGAPIIGESGLTNFYATCYLIPVTGSYTGDLLGVITDGAGQTYQMKKDLVTSLSSSSTDTQYPSAKCVYDIIGDVEALLQNV